MLFFDGVCNLCNWSVDFVIRHDKKHLFHFGSLQGETAHRVIPEFAEEAGLSTVVLMTGKGKFIRSSAIIQVLKGLGGFWKFLGGFLSIFPRPMRDGMYKMFVKYRYKWFGKKETCRLPTKEERALFVP